ncbi:hypothetical protein SPRG_00374 [Saprolegnia parasitica CBS 223.65]|uniref:Tudor domain-containing protein n=1 Tax=Saprolegnia parasitica (strain CBS 223.65) TaxID=695850 RepID=A0A067CYD8_SAPPC|nr:hypothetical protein SPRG_00374 [Saprolegnia parasitica CBS 223.65]KDO35528.1 hypothetical protein SPRG_00374 [Saprolegnia parasitica CBS 223.65]|eukprot:XP_012193863.1 hypothetical protein SPRG_00374 [Saprolegnia parasitica CBS 223.65]
MSEYDESFEELDEPLDSEPDEGVHASAPTEERASEPDDDGDEASTYNDESFVAESQSPRKPTSAGFAVGDAVDVYWASEEAWFHGRIQDASHPTYFVAYDDGDGQWEDVQTIRRATAPEAAAPRPAPASSPALPSAFLERCHVDPPRRVLTPRAYTVVAEHSTTEKIARPYRSVALHPSSSSTYLTPRRRNEPPPPQCPCQCYHWSTPMAHAEIRIPSLYKVAEPLTVVSQETQTVCPCAMSPPPSSKVDQPWSTQMGDVDISENGRAN